MTAIVCVDDRNGMMFGGRRLSRDRVLCEDIIRLCGTVWMNSYSAPLFETYSENIIVDDEFLRNADGFCFVETESLCDAELDGMILYRWNRRYPADVHLAYLPEEHGMVLHSSEEFAGSSHERITREIWRMNHGETQQ